MTMTRPAGDLSSPLTEAPIEWVRMQSGLWVGKAGGEFAGMIESRDGRFTAIRLSQPIGEYPTLSEAKRAFG